VLQGGNSVARRVAGGILIRVVSEKLHRVGVCMFISACTQHSLRSKLTQNTFADDRLGRHRLVAIRIFGETTGNPDALGDGQVAVEVLSPADEL